MGPSLPRGFTRRDLIPALLTLLAAVIGALIVRFFMVPYAVQVGFDEGYEAAAVERVVAGRWLPYVDAVSHRGPFLYWTQGILQIATGHFELMGTRLLGLLALLTTTLASFLTGWAAGWSLAGAVAAASNVLVIAIIYVPGGGIGVHGEPVAIAFATPAFFLAAYALHRARTERGRMALLVAAGALVAAAGLTKQTVAVVCAPLLLWLVADAIGGAEGAPPAGRLLGWKALRRGPLPCAAGGVAVVLLVLVRYACAGELRTLLYWSTSYNAQVYMQPYRGQVLELLQRWFFDQPWAIVGVAVTLTTVLARPLTLLERSSPRGFASALRASGFEVTVALTALLLLITAATPLRQWPHYFVPVFPFFGLTMGVLVEQALRRGAHVPLRAQIAVALVIGLVLVTAGAGKLADLDRDRARGVWGNPRPDPACAEIDRIAGAGREAIFIWGTAGDLYIACRRPSASKFTYTTVVAGIVPPFWNEPTPARVGRGSRETLMRELTAQPPPVIIDTPIGTNGMMLDIPELAAFLDRRYCRVSVGRDGRARELTYFGRKDLPACLERGP
jgi:hypothetical protein